MSFFLSTIISLQFSNNSNNNNNNDDDSSSKETTMANISLKLLQISLLLLLLLSESSTIVKDSNSISAGHLRKATSSTRNTASNQVCGEVGEVGDTCCDDGNGVKTCNGDLDCDTGFNECYFLCPYFMFSLFGTAADCDPSTDTMTKCGKEDCCGEMYHTHECRCRADTSKWSCSQTDTCKDREFQGCFPSAAPTRGATLDPSAAPTRGTTLEETAVPTSLSPTTSITASPNADLTPSDGTSTTPVPSSVSAATTPSPNMDSTPTSGSTPTTSAAPTEAAPNEQGSSCNQAGDECCSNESCQNGLTCHVEYKKCYQEFCCDCIAF